MNTTNYRGTPMKTALLASFLMLASNAHANFSSTILGDNRTSSSLEDKDFTNNNIQNLHRKTNELVLTFDDGPTPGVTEKVLDVLKEKGVKATFFVIASKVPAAPQIMQRMLEEGHIVANHSLNHQNLTKAGMFQWKRVLRQEIVGAHDILAPYMTNQTTYFFRAPEGAWEAKNARYLNSEFDVAANYRGPVMWDIGGNVNYDKDNQIYEAADWACWAKKMTVNECLKGYLVDTYRKKGGVVLMHDLRSHSAELLRKYIDETTAAGYTFVNLDQVNLNK